MSITVKVRYNNFDRIAAALPEVAGQVVRKTAGEIETDAKAACPVDTGTLRASLATETPSATRAIVGTNVEYAAHVEFGTRHMAARPYLMPAAERGRGKFVDAMRRLESHLPGS